jgi:hypothetical protein
MAVKKDPTKRAGRMVDRVKYFHGHRGGSDRESQVVSAELETLINDWLEKAGPIEVVQINMSNTLSSALIHYRKRG